MCRVSIITALHNKGRYVAATIRSILAQTMPDWEMIVVENRSADDGPEIVRRFSDPRIRLVVSPKQGPGAARNTGLVQATGEWVLFLDADDLVTADFLEERLGLLKSHPQADLLVGCWKEFFDGQAPHSLRHPTAAGRPTKVLEQSAIAFAPWSLHAALIRRCRITPDLYWPEELDGHPSEDTAFWFPVIFGADIAWSQRAGALYRVQTATSRNEIKDVEKWICGVIAVIGHNVSFLERRGGNPSPEQCANIARVLESNYRTALKRRARPEADLALKQAQQWLAKCQPISASIAVRKLLGLRLFNLLRYGAF
jgi:glycosyltransferase involved in cell wall biosynthesis